MKKRKPIFAIGIPFDENEAEADFELQHAHKSLVSLQEDYHIVVYLAVNVDNPIIQVFHEKDFKEADLDKIKSIVEYAYKKPVENEPRIP